MQIKDLILQLEALYNTYTEQDKEIMGEPTIEIDVFKKKPNTEHDFIYDGFSHEIKIEPSSDGVYHIFSAFSDSYPKEEIVELKPNDSLPWPFPTSKSQVLWPFPLKD